MVDHIVTRLLHGEETQTSRIVVVINSPDNLRGCLNCESIDAFIVLQY
jgi:hypothetical protein